MEKIEELFSVSGRCDRRHRTNTCRRAVPQDVLDAIEAGCSLETIERIIGDRFDVFKYNTQITIHGIFPETSTKRIGRYVNLVQNQNKSIGVRYSAIDCKKKELIADLLADCYDICRWHASIDSRSFVIQRTRLVDNAEQFNSAKTEFIEHMRSVGDDLYYGCGSVYHAILYGQVYIVEEFQINAFYERHMQELFESITGMKWSDVLERKAQKDAERKLRDAEYEKRCSEQAERAQHHKELKLQARDAFLAQGLPNGVQHIERYVPKRGDKIMLFHYEYNDATDSYSITPSYWDVYWIGAGQYKVRNGGNKKSALIGKSRYVLPKN